MKVTALIPDDIVEEVKDRAKGKNVTEALIIALEDWLASKRLQDLDLELKRSPLEFSPRFSAEKVRAANRRSRK